MENINLCLPFILVLTLFFSCSTRSNVETQQEVTPQEVRQQEVAVTVTEGTAVIVGERQVTRQDVFDPENISQEYYVLIKEDVQNFIEELNLIIRRRNYNAWKNSLSPEYFAQISSEENLRQVSELPAMTTRKIVLRTPEDYFLHVVVPSRANSRVDDIEFISRDRVKAFTITTSRTGGEQRLRLYDLERTGNMWKIIN